MSRRWEECGESVNRIKLIGRHVKNSVGEEVNEGERRGNIWGGGVWGVSTNYCFKMGRYLENKVEEGVRKGVEIMPEKRSENDSRRKQWEEK